MTQRFQKHLTPHIKLLSFYCCNKNSCNDSMVAKYDLLILHLQKTHSLSLALSFVTLRMSGRIPDNGITSHTVIMKIILRELQVLSRYHGNPISQTLLAGELLFCKVRVQIVMSRGNLPSLRFKHLTRIISILHSVSFFQHDSSQTVGTN